MNHLGTKKLETERLILRQFDKNDAEELYLGYVNQNEFLYYTNKQEISLEEQIELINEISKKYKNNDYYNWVITLKDNQKVIGSINLKVNEHNNSVQFNYAIDNRYTCKGYMTEALLVVKEFCLEELKVKRFQGGCCIENVASKKVMEKCNMQYEGTLRKYIKLKDGYHDMYMYSIVN